MQKIILHFNYNRIYFYFYKNTIWKIELDKCMTEPEAFVDSEMLKKMHTIFKKTERIANGFFI